MDCLKCCENKKIAKNKFTNLVGQQHIFRFHFNSIPDPLLVCSSINNEDYNGSVNEHENITTKLTPLSCFLIMYQLFANVFSKLI